MSGKLELEAQPVDLASVITAALDVARPSAQAKGIRLVSKLNPLAGQITGDPARLQWDNKLDSVRLRRTESSLTVNRGTNDLSAQVSSA